MIDTDRLTLRNWKSSDREKFVALNQDSEVMKYFPDKWDEDKSLHFIDFCVGRIDAQAKALLD